VSEARGSSPVLTPPEAPAVERRAAPTDGGGGAGAAGAAGGAAGAGLTMFELARLEEARRAAAELYRRALQLRPRFAVARIGLARVLLDLNDYEGALDEVEEARRSRPGWAEASAVEGRIFRASAQNAEAVEAYARAIREARGFQPEAHTGLGIIYEEEGKYEEAAAAYLKAVAQLSDTEPVLYELLGRVYERLEKYGEAVAAYEKYLKLAPNGKLAPAIESVIEQLRKQAAEQD